MKLTSHSLSRVLNKILQAEHWVMVKLTPGTFSPQQSLEQPPPLPLPIRGQDVPGDRELKGNKGDILKV